MIRTSARAGLFVVCLYAQDSPKQSFKDFYAQVQKFQEQASAAINREMAREKARDCGDEGNTRSILDCLEREIETSTANYKTYLSAIRSRLGLRYGDDLRTLGPTGTPLTSKEMVQSFDAAEAAWQNYRAAQCEMAFNLVKGGTAAHPNEGFCQLLLIRSHMRELEIIYHGPLHN